MVGKFKGDLLIVSEIVAVRHVEIVKDLPGLVFDLRPI